MFSIKLEGDKALRRALLALPAVSQRRVLRPIVTKAGRKVKDRAKQKAKNIQETGTLWRSIDVKVKNYKGTVIAIIGPARGKARNVTVGGREMKRDAVNYAHLVELGTVHSAAKPFLRPAFDGASGAVMASLSAGLGAGLEKEAARLARKR